MLKSITLEVVGNDRINCEGCEERVEQALKKVTGVSQVRARSSNQRVQVMFDSDVLDANAISDRIATVGYETRVVHP